MTDGQREQHWEGVYRSKAPTEVSWSQPRPDMSLQMVADCGLPPDAGIIDVGGGASTLVDFLIEAGHTWITVLDISEAALAHAWARLGERAESVNWIVADITLWRPEGVFGLWHDRAVLHFLTRDQDRNAYADALRSATAPGSCAVIAGFAPGGPLKCSGLEVVQHDADSLCALLGHRFALRDVQEESHLTPWGASQAFRYHRFTRTA